MDRPRLAPALLLLVAAAGCGRSLRGASGSADAGDGTDLLTATGDLAAPEPDLAGDGAVGATGAGLLLADSGEGVVFLLALDGTALVTYHSPVPDVTGVAHDRRAGDGFWLIGRSQPYTFYKLDWQGNTMRTVQNTAGASGASLEWEVVDNDVRGLDYYADPNPALDVLEFVKLNVNRVDTATTIYASSGAPVESAGFFLGSTPESGYWGCHVLDNLMNEQRRWCTRRGSTLERYNTATVEVTLPLSAGDPRGVALDEQGDFYVVDRAAAKILVLDPQGATMRSFATPGAAPEGLSYGLGPTGTPIR
jgi:DNA-binding beta-propeller fold protein YncE